MTESTIATSIFTSFYEIFHSVHYPIRFI